MEWDLGLVLTIKLLTMCNHTFLFSVIFSLGSSIISGQRTVFISDNGFSGTFDLEDNNLKEGSVIIEKLNTSVGEFSGAALKDFNIVFPVSCKECSFTLKNSSEPYTVGNIKGNGFSEILTAARAYSTQLIDAAIFQDAVRAIKKVNTLDAQRKLGYAAYNQFTDKNNADKLLATIEAGEFLPNYSREASITKIPVATSIVASELTTAALQPKEQTKEINETEVSKVNPELSPEEILADFPDPKTKNPDKGPKKEQQQKTNKRNKEQNQAKQEPRNAYKNDACNKTITKLETRLRLAEKKEDHLIINEVNHALKKHYKKCKK